MSAEESRAENVEAPAQKRQRLKLIDIYTNRGAFSGDELKGIADRVREITSHKVSSQPPSDREELSTLSKQSGEASGEVRPVSRPVRPIEKTSLITVKIQIVPKITALHLHLLDHSPLYRTIHRMIHRTLHLTSHPIPHLMYHLTPHPTLHPANCLLPPSLRIRPSYISVLSISMVSSQTFLVFHKLLLSLSILLKAALRSFAKKDLFIMEGDNNFKD